MTGALSPLVVGAVLIFGAVGAVLRYALSRALPVRPGHLPGGILIVKKQQLDTLGGPRKQTKVHAAIDDRRAEGPTPSGLG